MLALPFLRAAISARSRGSEKTSSLSAAVTSLSDVARGALRVGAEKVYEFCLEGPEYSDMPAHNWEIEEALEEGV